MKKSLFKKTLLFLMALLLSVALLSCKKDEPAGEGEGEPKQDPPTYENAYNLTDFDTDQANIEASGVGLDYAVIVFHYKRNANDYKNWGIWIWETSGHRLEIAGYDEFGVFYKLDLNDQVRTEGDTYHATKLGYIYFTPNWGSKDQYSADRFFDVEESMLDENNEIHLYSFEGVKDLYLDMEKEKPIQTIDTVTLANDAKSIKVVTNTQGYSYKLYVNGEVAISERITSTDKDVKARTMTLTIPISDFDISNEYTVGIVFEEGGKEKTKAVNKFSYYDTKEFIDNYVTDLNEELGVFVENGKTTFKLWAPISNEVSVQIWDAGHPVNLGTEEHPGDDEAQSYELVKGNKGVWSVTVDSNLYGKYYTFTVKNGLTVTENIVDPYAKAAGLNGLRGMILDFSTTNPEGWNENYSRPYSALQLIVYELHVRDITTHETWNGTEANRGKYLGLSEAGTKYQGVTTGFDHIKELGVNAIQILPFFDQENDELSDTFNWGYNPKNYNVLEGQYTSNPYDGDVRVREFKQMVKAYQEANIEVIMDVVYNHMNSLDNSSFHKIVPGYFFRYDKDGNPSNGSGCGNETASDRAMFRKFMIDSTEFWVTEYGLSGFRFDLMGLHDIETMNLLAANLKTIDNNIVVYGEPWTGGGSPLAEEKQAITKNVSKLVNVGAFNDDMRDGIKGPVFAGQDDRYYGGWLSVAKAQEKRYLTRLLKSTTGNFFNSSYKQMNYVSCHDNHTLYDILRINAINRGNGVELNFKESELNDADILAQGMIMTSSGVAFMLNGEELLRTKVIYDEEGNALPLFDPENNLVPYGVTHNSYNLPDKTNQIDWSLKVKNADVYNAYKTLISLRKNHPIFNAKVTSEEIGTASEAFVVKYEKNPSTEDTWSKALVIFGNINAKEEYTLEGNWQVAFQNGNVSVENGKVKVEKLSIIILYQE